MENATKALLIAAAVLVAIIIISLTLAIVRQGQDAVTNADLSEAEMTQFNQKFTSYQGENISTAQANQLLNTVFTHNQGQINAGDTNFVTVRVGTRTQLASSATGITSLTGSTYYSVGYTYNRGLVTVITLTAR